MINITETRIRKMDKGNLLAYVSIMIDDCFIIEGIELRDGKKGRYILMPLNLKQGKQKRNSAYPITNDVREKLLNYICDKYDNE